MPKSLYSFRGGIRIDDLEDVRSAHSVSMLPGRVEIPLSLSDGTVLQPLVRVGDRVLRGQPVARAEDGFAFSATIAGTVSAVDTETAGVLTVESDGTGELYPDCRPHPKKLSETSSQEIVDSIREAGILTADGSGMPLYRLLRDIPLNVARIIVNCTECEPYCASRDCLLREHPEEVVDGVKIIMRALHISKADLTLEDRREETVNAILSRVGDSSYLTVRIMDSKFPVSQPRVLFRALTGNDISSREKPEKYGFIILPAETCAAVYRKFVYGEPALDRLVTVAGGAIPGGKTLSVPLWTPFTYLWEFCGGLKQGATLLEGGPLSGKEAAPGGIVRPKTATLLALSPQQIPHTQCQECLQCGRCYEACPAGIYPGMLLLLSKMRKVPLVVRDSLYSCIRCGVCTAVCPSGIPVEERMEEVKEQWKQNNGIHSKKSRKSKEPSGKTQKEKEAPQNEK